MVELLGQGGMAEVYKVRHAQLESLHALKLLTIRAASVRDRLLQEGRVQASLRHPNAVAVTDVLEVDGSPALVMEFVDGPSLEAWLAEERPPLEEAERIFRGIVAAVAAAHQLGLVHRDLKPANVLMARQGGEWTPKVADFGLVKLTGDKDSLGSTRTGVAMGTPRYMAPEQIRDAKNVDERADIFSLGCILYELTTGKGPFEGDDLVEIFNRITRGEYDDPARLAPELPQRIRSTIAACLAVDRDQRPATCERILEILDGTTSPRPVAPSVSPAPTPAPPPRVARSSSAWLAGGVVGGVAVLAVVVFLAIIGVVATQYSFGPCGGWKGTTVGYVPSRSMIFFKQKGGSMTLRSDADVHRTPPTDDDDEGRVVCTIPEGYKLHIEDDPIKVRGKGTWVPVVAGAIERPQPEDGDDQK